MASLRTLEGVDNAGCPTLDDLFNVNDTLGCMLFGAEAWNAIKSYACNRALDLLACKNDFAANLRKISGKRLYIPTNDILEKAFGFNHELGCELYGVDEWREFVLDCKTNTPRRSEMGGIGDAITSMLKPSGLLYPETLSPGGIAQWILIPGLSNTSDAMYALGAKSATDKALEAKVNEANQNAINIAQAAANEIEAAKQTYNTEYARAKAAEDAKATANANLQYQLQTNPEYMANQKQNYIIIGAAVLGAAVLLMRK